MTIRRTGVARSSGAPRRAVEVTVAASIPHARPGEPSEGRRRLPVAVRALRAVVIVVAASYQVQLIARRWLPSSLTLLGAELILLLVAVAVLCGLRARRVRAYRATWTMFALSMACAAFSDVYLALHDGPVPILSPADFGWFGMYLLIFLGMAAGVWRDSARDRARVLLDGAVSGLGCAAVYSQVLLDVAMAPAHLVGADRAIALVYPTLDSFLVALSVCVLTAGRWSRRPSLRLAVLAAVGWALADGGYNTLLSYHGYTFGGVVDLAYVVAVAALGMSACLPDTWRGGTETAAGRTRLTLPAVFAVVALAQLLLATQRPISVVTVCLDGLTLLAGTARSIMSFRQAQDLGHVRHQEARRDELTGLANRRAYHEHLAAWAARDPRPSIAVLLLDLDKFKQVNDTLGHAAGDQLLIMVTERLRSVIRPDDLLARLGGDEFVVVTTGPIAGELRQVDQLAGRLRDQVRGTFDLDGHPADIDVSIGVAFDPDADGTPEELLQRADIAMYEAKKSRTGHQTYQAAGEPARPLEMIDLLRRDIDTDAMIVHYQPTITVSTGAVSGVEALVRWQHPDRGVLSPAAFLPLVEQAELMPVLTRNVLRRAIADCVRWRAAGTDLSLSVNISAADLRRPEFTGEVADLLHLHGFPPGALTLEITEATLLSACEETWNGVERLRELGVGVAIDECGAGPTGLAHLSRLLTVTEWKLAPHLLSRPAHDQHALATVRAAIDLAHALGLRVVADGVESTTTLHRLAGWHCDLAQGDLLGRPQTAASLTGLLAGTGRSGSGAERVGGAADQVGH